MKRINFLYTLMASILIFCFFNFKGFDKVKADRLAEVRPENEWLLHKWVVVEAYEAETGKDVTTKHASEVWQFLREREFVLYRDQILQHSGDWVLKNDSIRIQNEGKEEKNIFRIQKRGRNELLLFSDKLKVRLLKLDDI